MVRWHVLYCCIGRNSITYNTCGISSRFSLSIDHFKVLASDTVMRFSGDTTAASMAIILMIPNMFITSVIGCVEDKRTCPGGNSCDNGGYLTYKRRGCNKVFDYYEYYCVCGASWGGVCCKNRKDLCDKGGKCKNGATCIDGLKGRKNKNGYKCLCPDGYIGFHCEETDECDPNPCGNGCFCKDKHLDFQCTCPPGSIVPGSELDLVPTYKASSTYNTSTSADKAATEDGYWCSKNQASWLSTQYWWISFEGVGEEIVKITFEEQYPGAEFEFFASDTNECTEDGRKLISGTREKINGRIFENGKLHHCYGLKITDLPETKRGYLASLKHFQFFVRRDLCEGQTCSGRGTCIGVDNDYLCKCSDSYKGKNCEKKEVVCEDPDMETMFCLNGGTCIQTKTWYNYEADPDNYWLTEIYCHCAKGWKGERCDARTYPLNRANEMKVNDADRERV